MANFTKLLLHCDGTDASTTFTDNSIYALTMTARGNAQIDTDQSKFGNASGLFDSNDVVDTPDLATWDFGTDDFTIDFWVRFAAINAGNYLFNMSDAGTSGVAIQFRSDPVLRVYVQNTSNDFAWAPVINTWYHLAVTRSGSSLRSFIDGTQIGSTISNSSTITSTTLLKVGNYTDGFGGGLQGWLDEVRVSRGIARWTANFTPPSAAYDNPSSTSSSSSSSSCRSSSSSSRSSSSSSSSRSSSSSSCSSSSCSSSSSSCRSSSSSSSSSVSSSSSRSSSSSSSSSRSSSSSSSSCRSSSSSSCSSSSYSSSSSCSSSSSSSRSSSSSSSCSSSSSSRSSSSSSSSCRSSSSSSRSSSCSSSSRSYTPYKLDGVDKISSTITLINGETETYTGDVDADLKTLFTRVNAPLKIPRMTTAQRDALSDPFEGQIIVNIITNKLNWRTPLGTWEAVTSA